MYNTDTESFPVWKDRKTAEGMYAGFLNQEDMNMRKEWGIMKRKCLKASLAAVAALCLAACFTFAAGAEEGNRWDYTTEKDAEGNITIHFSEASVTLPASWSGNCAMSINSDSVDFFHIDSRDLWTQELGYANGGNLFSICYTQTLDYLDLPSFETLGNGADGIYYATTPTDVQGYYDNDQVMAEFTDMSDDVQWVLDNIQINGSSGSTVEISSSSDYILPQSSTEYLDESDLTGMSADQVQMAINEIYARHHRKFVLQDVQAYFDSKSWYDGYVEADEFDTRVMNQYEAANINLMVEYMEKIS